ncbi:MAG: M55 family metallopeptidase [Dehalococcoidia bacterium]|nr:M55 family metallopeptidase [Dehalococcoidia bacterium]MCL0059218.1 M55 family metallopeptidase [Dehalococcoidia bacterium]MCL0064002.1 M55 family metallopeptidase [Dehalococcoidia bacterium]MCL0090759.1 M55 family metallopeptidase [Dehalococcoidia bacterium]MCL0103640.1 M55 family metallopeptidase [Dehalococcoidia bacterium]
MNVLISVDMEGISGVVSGNHTSSSHKEYERFRKLMTAETNAAIEGALSGGATQVVINDSHGGMSNILIEELNPAALLISGSPKPFGMMQGMGPEIGVVFFVGYHAASGTGAAVLEHSWTGIVVEAYLNGRSVGEVGLNAALAGAYGTPVTLVTGDRAATEEARALLGNIETVTVKDGVMRTAACCLHPDVAQEQIREAAARALRLEASPFVLSKPVTLRVVFQRASHADMAGLIPDSRRVDGRTIEWVGEEMPAVYKVFRAMMVLSMANGA